MPDHTPAPLATDAIRTMLEGWYPECGIRIGVIDEAFYQLVALEAENAALRQRCETADADTARMDWLKKSHWTVGGDHWGDREDGAMIAGFVCVGIQFEDDPKPKIYESPRAAIDAAILTVGP